jgi:hypothetical protein
MLYVGGKVLAANFACTRLKSTNKVSLKMSNFAQPVTNKPLTAEWDGVRPTEQFL